MTKRCPKCGESVTVPTVRVRNTGLLVCSSGHLFKG